MLALLAATLLAALAIIAAGPQVVFAGAGLLVVALVLIYPRAMAIVLAASAIVVEPRAIDPTRFIARVLWQFPAAIWNSMPFQFDPFEGLLALTALSLLLRPRYRPAFGRLPRIAWLVPPLMAFGVLHGIDAGSKEGLLWHDLRALAFGTVAFLVAAGFARERSFPVERVLLVGVGALAVVTLARFAIWADPNHSKVADGLQFAHESSVIFGIGFILATLRLVQARSPGRKLGLLAWDILVLAAMMASGRRAAMLCLFAGALVLFWLLIPRRPLLMSTLALATLFGGGWLLTSQWDSGSGILSQPVRAIRSQIDPSARDASSDDYREIERENVVATLQNAPFAGVGFGQEYDELGGKVVLLDQWQLQFIMPHQSVLWLWLKMGMAGVTVFLTLWVLGLQRALSACRATSRQEIPVLPIVTASALLMCLLFASVDTAGTTRFTAVFATALAVALAMPGLHRPETSPKAAERSAGGVRQ